MLSVHIQALLPLGSAELDIPPLVQTAAVVGVGLVYEGSAHRHMVDVLLGEIGRPAGPELENATDRESYALASGLALGMVALGVCLLCTVTKHQRVLHCLCRKQIMLWVCQI